MIRMNMLCAAGAAMAMGLGAQGAILQVEFSGFVDSFEFGGFTSTSTAIPGYTVQLNAFVEGTFQIDTSTLPDPDSDPLNDFYQNAISNFEITVQADEGNAVLVATQYDGSIDTEFFPNGFSAPNPLQTRVNNNGDAIVLTDPDPYLNDVFTFSVANTTDYMEGVDGVRDGGMTFGWEYIDLEPSPTEPIAVDDTSLPTDEAYFLDPNWDTAHGWIRIAADAALTYLIFDITVTEVQGCPCDFNGTDGVNFFDLLDYLDAWFAGDAAADFDGADGVNFFDLLDFLDCWFAGCAA